MNSKVYSMDKTKKKEKVRPFFNFFYDFVKTPVPLPMYLWLRPKIHYPFGKTKRKGAILATANHRSFLDPIVVHMVFPFRRLNYLATKGLFSTKIKNFFFTQMHCIVVDKDNFSVSSFHDVVNRLEDGKVVVIFPEGQINQKTGNDLLAFKSGAAFMAHKSKASILPMYIIKRNKWYHRQQIVVGQPINIFEMLGEKPTMQDLNNASILLREKEEELREYFESLPIYEKKYAEIKGD